MSDDRQAILAKFDGRCAYCGITLGVLFHVDHVRPLFREWPNRPTDIAGDDEFNNKVAACPRCNLRKSALSLERFRDEIAAQVERLRRDSAAFRLAEDFGLIATTGARVRFILDEREAPE